jgi:RNA-directed DNA polymerase
MTKMPQYKDVQSNETLEKLWQGIDWDAAEAELRRLQKAIAIAANRQDIEAVRLAQIDLINAGPAKALAVRRVCASPAEPGVDGIAWSSDAERMMAALSLDFEGYKAMPNRLEVIKPKFGKERHVHVATFYDRAMLTLAAYALDPVAESTGDRKSFAFRKGRSTADVHFFIMRAFSVENPPKFLIKADVKSYYATISHKWLLKHIPMDPAVLREFLKAGHVWGGELFPPTDFGISLGSALSPVLGNMTLDGAQSAIYKGLHGRDREIDYAEGNMIRYADDLLITARTNRSATRILQILRAFLAERGLKLSESKTKVLNISEGFDFLSRYYMYADGCFESRPSKDSIAKLERSLRDLILPYRKGQKSLIEAINKKLVGWATFHKVTSAREAFRHIDSVVSALLLELSETLHPKWTRSKIIKKYFYPEADGNVYALVNKPDVRVVRLADTVLLHHQTAPPTKMNPYVDEKCFEDRTNERAIRTATGKYKAVWLRQGGKCYYCGRPILVDEVKQIVQMDVAEPNYIKNLAYVHDYCSLGQAEFYESDDPIDTPFDLHKFLTELKAKQMPAIDKTRIYAPLIEYFRRKREATFTLKFSEIEKILDRPLCKSAKERRGYWYMSGESRISHAWLSSGYKIRRLCVRTGTVVFQRSKYMGEAIDIPPVFMSGRIPPAAKTELETAFKYIKAKYGL